MNDRELLEFAAKAAGFKREDFVDGKSIIREVDGQPVYWNPLTDDGDAFRLAVKVGLDVWIDQDCCEVFFGRNLGGNLMAVEMFGSGDSYAATRLAIVKAAAEIGKSL